MLRTLLRTSSMMRMLPRSLKSSSEILSRFNPSAPSPRWNSSFLCPKTEQQEALRLDLSSRPLPKTNPLKRRKHLDDPFAGISIKKGEFREEIRKAARELGPKEKRMDCMYQHEILGRLRRAFFVRATMFVLDTLDPVVLKEIDCIGTLKSAAQTPDQKERYEFLIGEDSLHLWALLDILKIFEGYLTEPQSPVLIPGVTRLPTRFDLLKANLDIAEIVDRDFRKVIDRVLFLKDYLKKKHGLPSFDDPLEVWSFLNPDPKSA